MKTAHYYASKSKKFLDIWIDGKTPTNERYEVSGKREANKIAKQISAKPWNF